MSPFAQHEEKLRDIICDKVRISLNYKIINGAYFLLSLDWVFALGHPYGGHGIMKQ